MKKQDKMNALSYADQMEAMTLFYAKKARDARREAKKAAAAEEASLEQLFVPEEVVEVEEHEEAVAAAQPAEDYSALLVALGLVPALRQREQEEPPAAAPAARERKILPTTILSVTEDSAELVERVRNGEVTEPLWGTARYVPQWGAGKRGDPAKALPSQIRQEIRNGTNTKRAIQEALGVPMKDIDAAVREMSKMGLILC